MKTCYKYVCGSILDIMLTNKSKCFQKTSTVTTGLSDCHKMIVTSLKSHFNFSLRNIVNLKTCYKYVCGSILDIMLTNKSKCFQKTSTVTTGLSDCHKMIVTSLKAHFKTLPPKKIVYRD